MRPALLSAWIMVFIFSVREISAAILLTSSDNVVLSVLSWNYLDYGDVPKAAVVGLLQTVHPRGRASSSGASCSASASRARCRGDDGRTLRSRDLVVQYGDVAAVDGVSFDVARRRVRLAARPERLRQDHDACAASPASNPPSAGEIRIGGDVVARDGREVPPEKRGVNMVFQSYAVWPHMTVFDNVAYGLRAQRRAAPEIDARTTEALRLVGLAGYEQRYGTELSGGQQQRVAVARAVVTAPRLLLFDEPLSNLDAGLRERMRFELVQLQRRLGRTSIYVTHDQAEAMVMSDRIILMNRGRIVQESSPRELYERPASRFAAEFVGSANLLEAR